MTSDDTMTIGEIHPLLGAVRLFDQQARADMLAGPVQWEQVDGGYVGRREGHSTLLAVAGLGYGKRAHRALTALALVHARG